MRTSNLTALLIAVALIVGAIIYLDHGKAAPVASVPAVEIIPATSTTSSSSVNTYDRTYLLEAEKKDKQFERAKEITTPDGFINSPNPAGSDKPFTLGEFIGKKVVLLDIWTYSCINCQRTLPYLKSWYEKYKDKGLVIIGLHTPEFEFEKDYANVQAAVKKFGITYPVVLDNDYSTWHAYGNQYWPRHYLIDIDGYIVADHIGEGGYEETERQIQKALEERSERLGGKEKIDMPVTAEAPVPHAGSPETYFGASRNEYLGNGRRGVTGVQTFTLPQTPEQNTLYLGGEWDMQGEYAESKTTRNAIEFRYKAKEVYFVASSEKGVTAKIYNDGTLVQGDGPMSCELKGWCGGEDVSAEGTVHIKEDRLYKLIENKASEEHVLKIEIESSGLKAFTFTFG